MCILELLNTSTISRVNYLTELRLWMVMMLLVKVTIFVLKTSNLAALKEEKDAGEEFAEESPVEVGV